VDDGKLLPPPRRQSLFLTVGLHYGLAVFEGIRCYDTARGRRFFGSRARKRLIDSARLLRLETSYTAEQIVQGCVDVCSGEPFSLSANSAAADLWPRAGEIIARRRADRSRYRGLGLGSLSG